MAKKAKTEADNIALDQDHKPFFTKRKILPEEKQIQRLVIIALIGELRVNQNELSDKLGIHNVTLSSWKRGIVRIPIDMCQKMAEMSSQLKVTDFYISKSTIA